MDVHVPLGYIGTRDIACRFRELTFLYFSPYSTVLGALPMIAMAHQNVRFFLKHIKSFEAETVS